jgi:rhodanese-related sulfurtransferase
MWRYSNDVSEQKQPIFIIMNATSEIIEGKELQQLLAKGCCLVDVREPVEHAEERIAGAQLIPLGQLEKRLGEIATDAPVVVMCRGGMRGEQARKLLQSHGLSQVRNLQGGIMAWKALGLPVEKTARKILPLMQQVQLTIGLMVLTGAILALTVDVRWAFLCAFFGAGLTMAGSTGWCGLAILMSKMPWNKTAGQTVSSSGSCSL